MLFMVIETFRPGAVSEAYRRFRGRSRMAPADVKNVTSWVDLDFRRSFQIMEAESAARLKAWTDNGSDLVDFEIVAVRTSEAARTIAERP